MHKETIYSKYIKRLLDIILSLIGLIILSPVLLITALLVKTKLGSPVIFSQTRPGKDEKLFKMYKFRSMTDETNDKGELLSDEVRLTSFGKKLRSTSLDELPELFNILKGDMSIVGPRPLLVEYLTLYTKKQKQRHNVKPGITGLAQVSGRNSLTWSDKFNLDTDYIENITFRNDLKIILQTFKTVFAREGISDSNGISMKKFQGDN